MTLNFTHKKRQYDDGCAVAQIMDVIGERWALMVMRELIFGPRRFSDIRAALPGISANVLTQRLAGLEAAGIVCRRTLPPPAAVQVYELTQWGAESEILFRVIGRWAARSPHLSPAPMSVASIVLSMRTMFSGERAGDLHAAIGFHFGAQEFLAVVVDGAMTIEPYDTRDAEAIFIADPDALAAVLYGGVALDEMLESGGLKVAGDLELARRYVGLFPLPDRAPAVESPSTTG